MKAKPEKIYIEVFWTYRPQTLRQCTENFLAFLQKIATYQPNFFSTWYEQKETIQDTRQSRVQLTYTCVKNTFSETDKEDEMRIQPYFTCYTNGQAPPQKLILEASLGMGEGAKYNPNSCMIAFPQEGPSYDFYKNPSHLLTLMKLMIAHWDPSYIEIYNCKKQIDYPFPDEKLRKIIQDSFYNV